jgi:hypothetical protein
MVDLSAFQVLNRHDVRLALGAMLFNTSLVIAAWFGRAYWMHGIEMVVNKLQVSLPCWPPLTMARSSSFQHLAYCAYEALLS